MNATPIMPVYAWGADLENSRDVGYRDRDAFAMVIGWLEHWRLRTGLEPGREACKRFWRERVMAKDRDVWQLNQWSGAMQAGGRPAGIGKAHP